MSRPRTVLVLTRNTGGFFHGELLLGAVREISAAGARVLIAQTRDPSDDGTEVLGPPPPFYPVAWDDIDGAVVESLAVESDYLKRLQAEGKPVVLASHQVSGFVAPSALPDNRGGVRRAVEHLIAHGHTRIGFLGDLGQHDFRERHQGYLEAMAAHGLPAPESLHFHAATYSRASGAEAAPEVLAVKPRPTAVVTATDDNAIGLMAALAEAGVSVPDDIAVVGFDNVDEGAFTMPSLSSVGQRFDQVGALAARLVLRMIDGEEVPARSHTADAAIIAARGSCGCRVDLVDQRPRRAARIHKATATLRAELDRTLHTLLDGRGVVGSDVEAVIAKVEHLLLAKEALPVDETRDLITTLNRIAGDPETLQQVAGEVNEYLRELLDAEAGEVSNAGTAGIAAVLWELQARGYVRRSQRLEAAIGEFNAVAAELLRADPQEIDSLHWLAGTSVRAGVLALWEGSPNTGRLRIAGAFGDAPIEGLGEVVPVRRFPSSGLIASAREAEICMVVPVRDTEREWGLLAILGVIDTTSQREAYHRWSQMLSSALAGQQLQRAVRASEERYAYAARASNDGLWEMDVATRTMYISERCHEILGHAGELDAEKWQLTVHPEDRDRYAEAMSRALTHPEEPVEVEYRVHTASGDQRWVLCRALGIRSESDVVHRVVGSLSDVDERRHLEEQLLQAALFDPVTGLPNRRLFQDRLTVAIEAPKRRPNARFAVFFLDLDGFKLVNDSLGHLAGDELLRVVAERLASDLRSVDTAARFGGDEFAVLLTDPIPDEVLVIAKRIQDRISAPIQLGNHEVTVSASLGITVSETGYTDADDVLRDADIAMYQSKETERGTATVFDPKMHERAVVRLRDRTELNAALEKEEFVVHYQPVVPLDGSALAQMEALVRWEHPERGLLGPAEFLPAMVDNGTIVRLGHWVLDQVCGQIAQWRREHPDRFEISVNISNREFWAGNLVRTVLETLARHRVRAEQLILEITESVIMVDPEAARKIMTQLTAAGVRLQIDDFGTGHSSLHALRTFPVDALKIDGSFVDEMPAEVRTTELVRTIVAMGAALGVKVIAECVETSEQADELRQMGCGSAQGWLYARAMPAPDAGALLGTVMMTADELA